jgi:hypothetical protein
MLDLGERFERLEGVGFIQRRAIQIPNCIANRDDNSNIISSAEGKVEPETYDAVYHHNSC